MNESKSPVFRIGGVYRANCGAVVELFGDGKAWGDGRTPVLNGLNLDGRTGSNNGQWLRSGTYFNGPGGCEEMSLLPGELTFVDGEWRSAAELFIVDSKTPTLDKMEAEKRAAEAYFSFNVGDVIPAPASVDLDLTRPALDWNKPASTDRFPGFVVTSRTTNEPQAHGLASPDLAQSSHQVAAVFGSADLVRKR